MLCIHQKPHSCIVTACLVAREGEDLGDYWFLPDVVVRVDSALLELSQALSCSLHDNVFQGLDKLVGLYSLGLWLLALICAARVLGS